MVAKRFVIILMCLLFGVSGSLIGLLCVSAQGDSVSIVLGDEISGDFSNCSVYKYCINLNKGRTYRFYFDNYNHMQNIGDTYDVYWGNNSSAVSKLMLKNGNDFYDIIPSSTGEFSLKLESKNDVSFSFKVEQIRGLPNELEEIELNGSKGTDAKEGYEYTGYRIGIDQDEDCWNYKLSQGYYRMSLKNLINNTVSVALIDSIMDYNGTRVYKELVKYGAYPFSEKEEEYTYDFWLEDEKEIRVDILGDCDSSEYKIKIVKLSDEYESSYYEGMKKIYKKPADIQSYELSKLGVEYDKSSGAEILEDKKCWCYRLTDGEYNISIENVNSKADEVVLRRYNISGERFIDYNLGFQGSNMVDYDFKLESDAYVCLYIKSSSLYGVVIKDFYQNRAIDYSQREVGVEYSRSKEEADVDYWYYNLKKGRYTVSVEKLGRLYPAFDVVNLRVCGVNDVCYKKVPLTRSSTSFYDPYSQQYHSERLSFTISEDSDVCVIISGGNTNSGYSEYTVKIDLDSLSIDSPDPVPVTITLADRGKFAYSIQSGVVVDKEIVISDTDNDGKLTVYDALVTAHKTYNLGKFETDNSQYSITKMLGCNTNIEIGNNLSARCYVNDGYSRVLGEINAGDKIFGFIYSRSDKDSDVYTKFDPSVITVTEGSKKEYEVTLLSDKDLLFEPFAFAGIGIIDSTGYICYDTYDYVDRKKTDYNGVATFNFSSKAPGTYYYASITGVPNFLKVVIKANDAIPTINPVPTTEAPVTTEQPSTTEAPPNDIDQTDDDTTTESKKAYYHCQLYGKYSGKYTTDLVKKITHKGSKISFKGGIFKASSVSKYTKGKIKKLKNKTFKVSSKCKYYYVTGAGSKKVTKKKFYKQLSKKWYSYYTVSFYTNAKGQIYKIYFDTSL